MGPTRPLPRAPPPPSVVGSPATFVGSTGATLNGSVNPNGSSTSVYFEYGTSGSYGTVTSTQSAGSGTSATPVNTTISGLAPRTTYHYRLDAVNGNGTTYGPDQTFTTTAGPPVVTTGGSSAVTSTGALVNGTVDPQGLTSSAYFQYGTTNSYGSQTATQTLPGNLVPNPGCANGTTTGWSYHRDRPDDLPVADRMGVGRPGLVPVYDRIDPIGRLLRGLHLSGDPEHHRRRPVHHFGRPERAQFERRAERRPLRRLAERKRLEPRQDPGRSDQNGRHDDPVGDPHRARQRNPGTADDLRRERCRNRRPVLRQRPTHSRRHRHPAEHLRPVGKPHPQHHLPLPHRRHQQRRHQLRARPNIHDRAAASVCGGQSGDVCGLDGRDAEREREPEWVVDERLLRVRNQRLLRDGDVNPERRQWHAPRRR